MTKNIGSAASWNQIAKRSNTWGAKMNEQIIKFGALIQGSVLSMTTPLPASPSVGDVYINPANGRVCIWVDEFNDGETTHPAEWYVITQTVGLVMLVRDLNKWFVYTNLDEWQMLWDPEKSHRAIPREFSFYAPYRLRPRKTIFSYVATQEFVIEAGAPGSGAFCEIAPTATVVLTISKGGVSVGTVTFTAGATDGTVSIPSEVVVLPAVEESMYTQANVLTISSPVDTFLIEGVNVTICGEIRSID